ncbi:MAG: phosphatidylglycerophosphatase A [Candidatus Acidiferrales bacterium]
MNPNTDAIAAPASGKKPRLAFAIATVLGTGYLKPGPGTWGSLVGVIFCSASAGLWLLSLGPRFSNRMIYTAASHVAGDSPTSLFPLISLFFLLLFVSLGVWSAARVARWTGLEDPQFVVIDEVSGQQLTLLLALVPIALPQSRALGDGPLFAEFLAFSLLNWKFLLAGFVLFRLFDIAKPFPCKRLEKLPGGWGIMADDWMAGIYAAICLRLALHFHLLHFHWF